MGDQSPGSEQDIMKTAMTTPYWLHALKDAGFD